MIVPIYTHTILCRRISIDSGELYGPARPVTHRTFDPVAASRSVDLDNLLATEVLPDPGPTALVIAPGARFVDRDGKRLLLTARGELLPADVALFSARAGMKGLRLAEAGTSAPAPVPPCITVAIGPPPSGPPAPTTQAGFSWAEDDPAPARPGKPRRKAEATERIMAPAGSIEPGGAT